MQIAQVILVAPVPMAKLSLEMEATLGAEVQQEPKSVSACQERLLEKLNLDGLSNWSPRNAAAARELILVFHDIFALDNNELGCMSVIEHEIHKSDGEPFKVRFRCIPPLLLEEVHTSLHDVLNVGAICPSQSPWCNAVVLIHKKDRSLHFCIDFCCLNAWTKKDSYPLLWIQEALESMVGAVHFSTMDFKTVFGKSKWPQTCNSILLLLWRIWGSMNLPACLLAFAMPWPLSSALCRIQWES